jgi:hypothetical protein
VPGKFEFDPLVWQMAAALAYEFPHMTPRQLCVYAQQATIQGYNCCARPFECLPMLDDTDDRKVTLWPNHKQVMADGAKALELERIRWKWLDTGSEVKSPAPEQITRYRLEQGDRLFIAEIEHETERRRWQQRVGQLSQDGWPWAAAVAEAGPQPGFQSVAGYAVVRMSEMMAEENRERDMTVVGFDRAGRQAWLSLVDPASMTIARRRRAIRDEIRAALVDAPVDGPLGELINNAPVEPVVPVTRTQHSDLKAERPFG